MLSEVFAAGSDDEAKKYLHEGAAAGGAPDVVETTELTSVELDLLQTVLTGEDFKDVVSDEDGETVGYGGETGPWVKKVRPPLAESLAELDEERTAGIAASWQAYDELAEADADDVRALVADLAALASDAQRTQRRLYLWNKLDSDQEMS